MAHKIELEAVINHEKGRLHSIMHDSFGIYGLLLQVVALIDALSVT